MSTIQSYIKRFREAPPTSREERTRELEGQEKDFWWLHDNKGEDITSDEAMEGMENEGDQDHVRLKQSEDGTFEMIDSVDFENLKKEVQENSIPKASLPYHEQFLKYAEEHGMDLDEARERYEAQQQGDAEDIKTQEEDATSNVGSDDLYEAEVEEYSEDFEGSGSHGEHSGDNDDDDACTQDEGDEDDRMLSELAADYEEAHVPSIEDIDDRADRLLKECDDLLRSYDVSNVQEKSSIVVYDDDDDDIGGGNKQGEIVYIERDKQVPPTLYSVKSKDSLFEALRVSDDYESIHRDSHHVKNNNINDVVDDHEEALDALSPLSGIAAVGFLNRKQERSVVSEEDTDIMYISQSSTESLDFKRAREMREAANNGEKLNKSAVSVKNLYDSEQVHDSLELDDSDTDLALLLKSTYANPEENQNNVDKDMVGPFLQDSVVSSLWGKLKEIRREIESR